ncbi:hypothetical protein BS47DRAFT_1340820 [Hydnum rufescens UP504]|uniref:Uncharacterized protein n=1 Tax=Hydnum rufescens UP504 TaxID=1448309 RepID=A0A9P6B3V8_9AGAM|nr:hypothetical protein BS47DRAFT_1340820 [Hydnum rufescens UP504]
MGFTNGITPPPNGQADSRIAEPPSIKTVLECAHDCGMLDTFFKSHKPTDYPPNSTFPACACYQSNRDHHRGAFYNSSREESCRSLGCRLEPLTLFSRSVEGTYLNPTILDVPTRFNIVKGIGRSSCEDMPVLSPSPSSIELSTMSNGYIVWTVVY